MRIYRHLGICIFFLVFCCCKPQKAKNAESIVSTKTTLKEQKNVAYQWAEMTLLATANDTERFTPRPTVTSRYLGLIFTAMFDAWSRYDEHAIPVYLTNVERRPKNEFSLKNKEIAISYAAYRALSEYYYSDKEEFQKLMKDLGLDPDVKDTDPNSPITIGLNAAEAVILARKGDGSNQYGEEEGSNGIAYYDYSGYIPFNSVDELKDANKWQPKNFSDGKGGFYAPECLTPFWHLVTPITLTASSQFRPEAPPLLGSHQLENEIKQVVQMQANLSDKEKALVEYMRDGPKSVQQAGHWLKFALEVSKRDKNNLDEDVTMLFYNQIVAMDAFIASWDAKMYYDFGRPNVLVHEYYKDQEIVGWAGPNKGFKKIKGTEWRPYSPDTFLCPPFPSYVSGHSTVSAACAEALKLWTGNDAFGVSAQVVAGALTEPQQLGDTITLRFPTFTETAEMAGISRVLGGYHIQSDNVAGLMLGRKVAQHAFIFYKDHLGE